MAQYTALTVYLLKTNEPHEHIHPTADNYILHKTLHNFQVISLDVLLIKGFSLVYEKLGVICILLAILTHPVNRLDLEMW